MLNKLTIALSTAIMLGAVSTASANLAGYDGWIHPGPTVEASSGALQAFASVPAGSFEKQDLWIQPSR